MDNLKVVPLIMEVGLVGNWEAREEEKYGSKTYGLKI
tara:strand:+ start:198 stop:308 length:111 start_codon:yes stop_codon:yes gene_type:complete